MRQRIAFADFSDVPGAQTALSEPAVGSRYSLHDGITGTGTLPTFTLAQLKGPNRQERKLANGARLAVDALFGADMRASRPQPAALTSAEFGSRAVAAPMG